MHKKALNILIAPDKFKGSLGAVAVAEAIARGMHKQHRAHHIVRQPMADGGDGSIDLLAQLGQLTQHTTQVNDPLFRPIEAVYYTQDDTAFIEMAKASGLALLAKQERNCLNTTSLGTGELILDAIRQGFRKINLFIGGSATNDAAIGIAQALGYQFLDQDQQVLAPIGGNLERIASLKKNEESPDIDEVKFQVVCDVNNPFFGESGAAHVYAPQKGANAAEVAQLDQGLRNIHEVFRAAGLPNIQDLPGAGAAGGIGGGMVAMFGARLVSGIDLFIDWFGLEAKVQQADVVITGEGQLDEQSVQGKVIGGVAQLCKKHQKPLIVVCGQNTLSAAARQRAQIREVKAIMEYAPSVEEAMGRAAEFLETIGEAIEVNVE
ncbi:MAG TPA: glycerate kinase [Microscillaceae bacterium]|nr:glycerate kinase [Microscillaceae bacterium]